MVVEQTVRIARPVSEVFAYLEDQRNATAWREGVISNERVSPGSALKDATFREVAHTPMGQQTATYEVTEVVRNERIEFRVNAGAMKPHAVILLSPVRQGTELTYRLDTHASGMMKLMEKGFAKYLREMMAKSADNVKTIMERGPTA